MILWTCLFALGGGVAGAAAGEVYLRLLARAIASAVAGGRPAALLVTAPVRLAIPVLVLYGLVTRRGAAFVGGACGLTLALARAKRGVREDMG